MKSEIQNMIYENFEGIPFQNRAKQRLRQIYAVLYYMRKGDKHTTAINKAYQDFKLKNNTAIIDKCTRQFAGKMKIFLEWYNSGRMLEKLVEKNELNRNDRKIFAELLEGGVGEIEEASVNSKSQNNTPDLSELSKIVSEIDVVEESSEEDDSYGQADLIKKSFEEWAKDAEKGDIYEATQSEVSSKTHTVQERKDVESDYKKVPDDKSVKIESWKERQRKREVEIQQTLDWFVEETKKGTKKGKRLKISSKRRANKQYTGLITEDQLEFIEELISRFQALKINKSSVLRAMIELLKEVDFDYDAVESEEDFIQAVKNGIINISKASTNSVKLPIEISESGISLEEVEKRYKEIEKRYIFAALRRTKGNQTQAAKLLGITRRTLQYRIDKYDIDVEAF